MKELPKMIDVWQHGEATALATLVKVEGSAYRRPGARMLITSDGRQVGTVSGGCLESDVIERSQQVLKTGIPTLVKYDTTSEDDLIWGLGLGCQGVAYILIERLDIERANSLNVIEQCLTRRKAGAIATVFRDEGVGITQIGDRLLLYPDGSIISQVSNCELENAIVQDLQSVLKQQKSATRVYILSGTVEVFLEVIQPPTSLVIFGAGFDVLPVVHFAKELGWYVTVIDPLARPQTKERFKQCDCLILGSGDKITSQIEFDEQTVAVAMSHNYLYDLEFLQTISTIPLKYLGILGPKKRSDRLLQDLSYKGNVVESELYSPVGLDIGADNPETIALAIIAEIQAVTQNRQGGFLKHRLAPIHSDKMEVGVGANHDSPVQVVSTRRASDNK